MENNSRHKPSIRVKRYTGDLKAIVKLDDKLIGVEMNDVRKHIWFVAEVDGEMAGYAGLKLLPYKEAYLARAGVLEKFRGLGLQKRLIRARERYAVRQGSEMMVTYTANSNWPSIKSLMFEGYHNYEPAKGVAWAGREGFLYWRKSLK